MSPNATKLYNSSAFQESETLNIGCKIDRSHAESLGMTLAELQTAAAEIAGAEKAVWVTFTTIRKTG